MDNKILLSELVEKLAVQSEISKRAAESFLRTFFALIEQNMLSDRYVKIKDIGTFKLVDVNDRESVNVATGERIQIESHSKISFVAEGKLRDLVNRPFAYLTNIELEDETTMEELNSVDKALAVEEELNEGADAPIMGEEGNATQPSSFMAATSSIQEEEGSLQAAPDTAETATDEDKAPSHDAIDDSQKSTRLKHRNNRRRRTRSGIKRNRALKDEEPTSTGVPTAAFSPAEQEEKVETPIALQPAQGPENEPCTTFAHPVSKQSEAEVEESEKKSGKKRFLRIGFVVAAALILIGLTVYFAYFHEPQKILQKASGEMKEVVNSKAETNITAAPQDSAKQKDLTKQQNQTKQEVSDANEGIAPATPPEEIKQIPNAGYEIMGTQKIHTMRNGEDIKYVALITLGSADLVNYVIFYNDLTDISNLGPGSKIKIPTLRRKSTGEIINKK